MAKKCPKCHANNPDDLKFCGECGTQLPAIEDIEVTETLETPKEELTTGSTFAGRYQIIEELGKGGMGRVYKVLDKEVNAKVALKLIKPEIASDKKTIERFRNELKVARDISHKNVCRMYDLGREESAYYITMEYVSGEDLKSFIRRSGILSVGKAISIAKQVCEGLNEAHRLGVVHRDLKPQNIMIDKDGNARIMDFGIARSLKAKGITGSGVMIGTPEYMSPEQVDGKEADQRADIYSLGVILYEIVTGRVPFEGDTPFSIGIKQKSETPRPPREINEQIPDDLDNVILKCMEKDKEKRFQSVGELQSELMNLEKGIPTTERIVPERKPLTSREITVKFSLKKLFIPALVIFAIVIIGLILWQILPEQKAAPLAPPGKPSLAIVYFENNTGDEELDHWRKAIAELLITDLSQSKYIKVLGRDSLYNILIQTNLLDAKSYSSEDIQKVAARGGVNHVLQGGFVKAGETFRISYVLQEASSGKLLGSESMEGKGEESILSMVDDMTKRIKENFELSQEIIASDIDKNIGTITTSSPEALKFFIQSVDYYNQGEYELCVQFLKRAVDLDPNFAHAHYQLGSAYQMLGNLEEEKKHRHKALELIDRVSDREAFELRGVQYRDEEKYGKSIEEFEKMLELYPDDATPHAHLAQNYTAIEEWDKTLEWSKLVIRRNPMAPFSHTRSAIAYRAKGLYDDSRELLENYLSKYSHPSVYISLIYNCLCQRNLDCALDLVDKAISLYPDFYALTGTKGRVFLFEEDFVSTEEEFKKLFQWDVLAAHFNSIGNLQALYLTKGQFELSIKQVELGIELADRNNELGARQSYYCNLSNLHLMSGNFYKALDACQNAREIALEEESLIDQANSLYWIGRTFLEMGLQSEVQKTIAELKQVIDKGANKKLLRLYYHLLGMVEIKKKNYELSADYFTDALSLYPYEHSPSSWPAEFRNSLAHANYESGDLLKAQNEFEKITRLTLGRFYSGHIYAKSFYMLGKIHEQKGETANAIEHYEKFLDLWKDADSGITEVEDARKRLALMKEPS